MSKRQQVEAKNYDRCARCKMEGDLLMCDFCPRAYHLKCAGLSALPTADKWKCPHCLAARPPPVSQQGDPAMQTAELIFGDEEDFLVLELRALDGTQPSAAGFFASNMIMHGDHPSVMRGWCLSCKTRLIDSTTRMPLCQVDCLPELLTAGADVEIEPLIQKGIRDFSTACEKIKRSEYHLGNALFLCSKLCILLEENAEIVNAFHNLRARWREHNKKNLKAVLEMAEAAHALGGSADLAEQIEEFFKENPEVEAVQYDPRTKKLPMTTKSHCSNCGETSVENPCEVCEHEMHSVVDYAVLTEAFVWPFVFGETKGHGMSKQNLVALLPEIRKYKELDEMGLNAWTHQCYFVTHFLYVMSNWGTVLLRAEMYIEEFTYIARNMVHAIRFHEAEIVGEFLHCLGVLGCNLSSASAFEARGFRGLKHVMRAAIEYLSKKWFDKLKPTTYDLYHAAFCGVAGLAAANGCLKNKAVVCSFKL